mgnify:CR=1 FL=1
MNFWKASTIALTLALAGVGVYETARPAHAEAQPNMQAALGLLQSAQNRLEQATADKGGHRVKAIEATKLAIEETKKGIEFDNEHKK